MKHPAQAQLHPISIISHDPAEAEGKGHRGASGQSPPTQQYQKWSFETGVQVTVSDRFKFLLGIMVVFAISGVLVYNRIRSLESRNEVLQAQLNSIHSTLNEIIIRLPMVPDTDTVNQVPTPFGAFPFSTPLDGDEETEIGPSALNPRPAANISRKTKRSVNDTDSLEDSSSSINNGSNEVTKSDPLSSKIRNARRIKERERGKGGKLRDELMKLKLKLKLANSRRRAAISDLNRAKLTSSLASEAKAIYLVPTGNNINIEKREQLIGPWYVAEDGNEYGFNDLWYKDIALDGNGTSVIFQESGLHLIYAQVYYHLTLGHKEKPAPMGYRIYVRKNPKGKNPMFQRPIPIAECVPSYPSTYYQTCFTQVAWFMDKGDQIFLEHFAKSFPMIEADKQGKTFLGIVRLSGSHY